MLKGDHLYVKDYAFRVLYEHHGIDMGDGSVIHLAPSVGVRAALRDTSNRFSVRRSTRDEFAGGRQIFVVQHLDCLAAEEIIAKAESMLGKTGYNLLDGNCEHFAMLCATGRSTSRQIEMGAAAISVVASMATKAFWLTTGKIGTRVAIRGAAKFHPAAILADGVELVTLAVTCRQRMSPETARRLARVSGNITAVGVGALVGGPAGAAAGFAVHTSSSAVAEKACSLFRRLACDSPPESKP